MHRLKILILDHQCFIQEGVNGLLAQKDILIHHTAEPREAIRILHENQIDLALVNLEHHNLGIKLVNHLKIDYPEIDAMIFDGTGEKKQLFSSFAPDNFVYISKPFHWSEIQKRIEQSRSFLNFKTRQKQLDLTFKQFSKIIQEREGFQFIGISPAIKTVASMILMVAASDDTSVLITGESGTGKELVARGIHLAGNRYKHPFHAVNCSAIPESLFESEFFGYHKGAFTGAAEKSTGWFESSNHGTLFLDEISELPLSMQSKFLRVLDDKTISKIGSHQQIKLNLRIVAATNQNFGKLLSKNTFREDLFHRLNSFHIHIPPLRERKEDIPILLDHFVSEISKRFKKMKNEICPDAIEKISNYPFPGNVRELKNMVERAVIIAQNEKLKLHHFCIEPGNKPDPNILPCPENSLILDLVEKNAIIEALNKTRNNKSRAAALLAISRQALDRKITKLNLFKVN